MAALNDSAFTDSSVKNDASFLLREAETFFAEGTVLRIASQICASHIPHTIPSIFSVYLIDMIISSL